MRHSCLIAFVVLLLSACGGAPQTGQPTSAPESAVTAVPTVTVGPSPTISAETEELLDSPALADHQSLEEPTEVAPTSAPATAAPTEQLILDPTPVPTAGSDAQPTAAPAAQEQQDEASGEGMASPPARLVIDSINLDRSLESVGLDENRIPIVPNHEVGWYNLSSTPGSGENIVLWGHVLRFRNAPDIPAPFARLKELAPGASVVLFDRGGAEHRYVVTEQVWVTPDQVEYILPQGKERITMVSCIGDKVIIDGGVEMTHRLITIAEPEA